MRMRPVDENGDVLPVLTGDGMLSGAAAVAKLVEDRLKLYAGDWWENPAWGNEILRMLQEGRLTEADAQSLSTYLASYVRSTSGVKEVQDEKWDLSGSRFFWSCTASTEYGSAAINYSL